MEDKLTYKKPGLFVMNSLMRGEGKCDSGSTAQGRCDTGNGVSSCSIGADPVPPFCQDGGSVAACLNGGVASITCTDGTDVV